MQLFAIVPSLLSKRGFSPFANFSAFQEEIQAGIAIRFPFLVIQFALCHKTL